jgi:hypothetical protein
MIVVQETIALIQFHISGISIGHYGCEIPLIAHLII